MNARISNLLIGAVLLAAGFGLGRMIPASAGENQARASESSNQAASAMGASGKAAEDTKKAPKEPSLGKEAISALSLSSSTNRMRKFHSVLSRLDDKNWQGVWDAFKLEKSEGRPHKDEWEQFLMCMGDMQGEAAMKRLLSELDVSEKLPVDFHYIMRGWAAKNPEAASAWLGNQPSKKFRDSLYSGYLGGMAEADIERAMKDVQKVPPESRHYFFYDLAPRVFQSGGLALGRHWMEDVAKNTDLKNPQSINYTGMVFREVSAHIVDAAREKEDPKMAFEWMKSYLEQPYFSQSKWIELASNYVNVSPEEAMQSFAEAGVSPANMGALEQGIRQWSKTDLAGAGQWLRNQHGSLGYDRMTIAYAAELQKSDPAAAEAWMKTVSQ